MSTDRYRATRALSIGAGRPPLFTRIAHRFLILALVVGGAQALTAFTRWVVEPVPVRAQGGGAFFATICANHDFDSATTTWVLLDQDWRPGTLRIKTTGSSATIDAASGSPFDAIATASVPGALIRVETSPGTTDERYVLTKASGAQITVNAVASWDGNGATGFPWDYKNFRSVGTAAGSGWFSLDGVREPVLTFQIEQLSVASGSVEVFIETRPPSPWAAATQIYPPTGGTGQCGTGQFTVAGATARCEVKLHENAARFVRFGVRLTDDAGDLTTNLERVSAFVTGYR